MHLLNKFAAVLAGGFLLVAMAFLVPPSTQADEWNQATRFSMNHQFEVPGAVLDPDTKYVMRLLDSNATRNVVQVFNGDESKLLTTFMAVSAEKMRPADKTEFEFFETDPSYPMPIRTWFYPGRTIGLEFLYPKNQRQEIAAHMRGRAPATATAANVPRPTEPQAQIEQKTETEVQLEKPAEPSVIEPPAEIAQNEQKTDTVIQREKPAEPSVTEPQATAERELPHTAGELPLVGLVGLLCLGVGLSVKVFSARS